MLRSSMGRAARIVGAVGIVCVAAADAGAASITYSIGTVADGNLGDTGFSGAPLVVTVTADTAGVRTLVPGVRCNDAVQATFSIGGVVSGSITTPVSVANNAGWQLLAISRGRCDGLGAMWVNGQNPGFGSYDLASELGPVALTMPGAPSGVSVETSQGVLELRGISAPSFHAQLRTVAAQQALNAATAVPTLSAGGFGLLTVILAGVGAIASGRRGAG